MCIMESTADGRKMELTEFIRFLKRKIAYVLIPTMIITVMVVVYVFFIAHPVFEATAQLYVVNSQDSVINLSDLQIGSYLTSDYQWIFRTWEVNQQVINQLHLPYTVEEIQKKLTVKNPNNTRILTITFESTSAKEAAEVANTYADVASKYISDYMLTNKPSIISIALEPIKPSKPKKVLLIGFSFAIALSVSLCCVFIACLLDDKISTADDIKKHMGMEPMAILPLQQKRQNKREGKRHG